MEDAFVQVMWLHLHHPSLCNNRLRQMMTNRLPFRRTNLLHSDKNKSLEFVSRGCYMYPYTPLALPPTPIWRSSVACLKLSVLVLHYPWNIPVRTSCARLPQWENLGSNTAWPDKENLSLGAGLWQENPAHSVDTWPLWFSETKGMGRGTRLYANTTLTVYTLQGLYTTLYFPKPLPTDILNNVCQQHLSIIILQRRGWRGRAVNTIRIVIGTIYKTTPLSAHLPSCWIRANWYCHPVNVNQVFLPWLLVTKFFYFNKCGTHLK